MKKLINFIIFTISMMILTLNSSCVPYLEREDEFMDKYNEQNVLKGEWEQKMPNRVTIITINNNYLFNIQIEETQGYYNHYITETYTYSGNWHYNSDVNIITFEYYDKFNKKQISLNAKVYINQNKMILLEIDNYGNVKYDYSYPLIKL